MITKKCFKCKKIKELNQFYKNKTMIDGHVNKCKECTKEYVKNNPRGKSSNKNSYDKTEKGVIRVIYKTQRSNSKQRNHPEPTYTKEELKIWLYENNFKILYDAWKKHSYNKSLKPSIDRINSFNPYTLDNIELTTDQENRNRQYDNIRTGQGTSGKKCKPVIQYRNGNEIARYVSFSQARRIMKYSMESSLRTGKIDKFGYSYRYE